jgi:hypothetical protein
MLDFFPFYVDSAPLLTMVVSQEHRLTVTKGLLVVLRFTHPTTSAASVFQGSFGVPKGT